MRPFDILDLNTTPFPTFEAASAQLLSLRADLEVENLSYWHIGPHGANLGDAVWISTYPREYRDLYLKLELQKGDPAFALSFERLLPTDWDDIHSLAQSRPILEAAHDFHIRRAASRFRSGTRRPATACSTSTSAARMRSGTRGATASRATSSPWRTCST